MSVTKIIRPEQYKRSTWKNGLGHTDEISIYPPQASLIEGNFAWRLSSARIEKASPFSLFPNHDRILVILSGTGIRLFHTFEEGEPDEQVELPRLEPYEFPGDIRSRCELVEGPVVDFSVFFRKGEVQAMASIQKFEADESWEWSPEGRWNFVFAVQGKIQTEGGTLEQGSTLWLEQSEADLGQGPKSLTALKAPSTALIVSLG